MMLEGEGISGAETRQERGMGGDFQARRRAMMLGGAETRQDEGIFRRGDDFQARRRARARG